MKSLASGVDAHLERSLKSKISQATHSVSRQSQWRLFTLSLVINDVLMTALAFRLAYVVRFELSLTFFQLDVTPSSPYYRFLVLLLIPLWLIGFAATGLYDRQKLLGGAQEYDLIFRATTLGLVVVMVFDFLQPKFVIARGWLVLAWGFTFLCVAAGRFGLRRVVYFLRQHGYY